VDPASVAVAGVAVPSKGVRSGRRALNNFVDSYTIGLAINNLLFDWRNGYS
jgi:hypothetical protein